MPIDVAISPAPDAVPLEGEELEWRVHLLRERPAGGVAVAAAVAAAATWGFLLFQHPVAGLVGAGLVLASAGEFVFPLHCRLNAEGAEVRNPFAWRKIAWKDVRRVYTGEEGVRLSPLAHGGVGDGFRGVLLRCRGNREEVLQVVRRYRDAARDV
ncbi:MAG: hypothetical protein ACK47B_09815 [Armatimonadota bacterium]